MTAPSDRGAAAPPVGPRGAGGFFWPVFEKLMLALSSAGSIWIFVLMIVINIDVIGRTALNAPLPGVPELVSLSIVGIIFIQLGNTLREGRMTRADTFIKQLQRRWPRIGFALGAAFSLAGAALFAVLFYASYPFFLRSWESGEFVGVEGYVAFPTWPVRLAILVGCACAVIQFIHVAVRDLQIVAGLRRPEAAELEERGISEEA
jgi:TRAP-type mannitol/chloroaromatic compound transport system permease small subunit